MTVKFLLNGLPVRIAEVDHHLTLLQWLRASGRTGTKEGCSEGECGACAVAWVKPDSQGRLRFESVNSCLLPVPAAEGHSIVTVEGVAEPSGELHPVQKAMVLQGGSQCGYCTPGFVVSLFCEYYRPGRTSYDPESISGNLCRCTGYRPIADVARAMTEPPPGDPRLHVLAARAPVAAPSSYEHRSAAYQFVRPASLDEVWKCFEGRPDAVLIAGGTDLMVYSNQRYDRFPALISLEAIPELQRFELAEDEMILGAGLRLSEIEERLAGEHAGRIPLLEQLLPLFSSRLIRNRATLGGNLATASPIGDSPPVLLALDAAVTLASARGQRRIALADFFLGYRATALQKGELIVSVHVPLPLPQLQSFYKVSKRVLDDISTVSAAFALDLTAEGRVKRLMLAYGGVAATPVRAHAVEQLAQGKNWSTDTLALLLPEVQKLGTPLGDHRGSAGYRRAMTGKLLEKFFAETATRKDAAS